MYTVYAMKESDCMMNKTIITFNRLLMPWEIIHLEQTFEGASHEKTWSSKGLLYGFYEHGQLFSLKRMVQVNEK